MRLLGNRTLFNFAARGCALFAAGVVCLTVIGRHSVEADGIMPPKPSHGWLLDQLGAGPYGDATPDEFGSAPYKLPLYGVKLHGGAITSVTPTTRQPELAGPGDFISVTPADPNNNGSWGTFTQLQLDSSAVRFNYPGNKSAVNDWGTTKFPASSSYPERVNLTPYVGDAQALPGGGLHINGSTNGGGAISFWFNPIRHDPSGYGYFFDFVDTAGNRLAATANAYENDETFGSYVKTAVNGADGPIRFHSDPTHYADETDPAADPFGWGPGVNFGGFDTLDSHPGGRWSNIVITWGPDGVGGSVLRVYSNGDLFGEVSGMVVPDFYATAINIGGRAGGGYAFPALIDEVGIWDQQLTQDHVDWLYTTSLADWGALIPEPASAGLLLTGMIGLAVIRRKLKRTGSRGEV